MKKVKWYSRVGTDKYVPTLKCANCHQYVFPAPSVWTRWVEPNYTTPELAVTPEAVWTHIHTLRVECDPLILSARPSLEEAVD